MLVKAIAAAIGGHGTRLAHPDDNITTLLTDSRSLANASEPLFFAIRTATGDGHRYIRQLAGLGCRNFVVETTDGLSDDANYIVVDNTIDALQQLAARHRRAHDIPVIAVTGSRGKTQVKEWLYQLLCPYYRIARSPRSYNSQTGVPLSLWGIGDDTTLAIIEAGISLPGEMQRLKPIIQPTIGVFTTVTSEHGENFANRQQIAAEKATLFDGCPDVVFCADNTLIAQAMPATAGQATTWSQSDDTQATIHLLEHIRHERSTTLRYRHHGRTHAVELPFTGTHHIANAMQCICVMTLLGISDDNIASGIASLTPVHTRISVIEGLAGCTIIADSCPSDLSTLPQALNFMARRATPGATLTAIISDATHETLPAEVTYSQIAALLERNGISRLIGVGKQITAHRHLFDPQATFFASVQELTDSLNANDFYNTLLLVKGSSEHDLTPVIDMLEAKQHETVMEVNLDAATANYNFFRSKLCRDTKIVCMLKASGYGAGSYELAKSLQDCGVDYIAVAVHDEGVSLRQAGITTRIMVLNPRVMNYQAMFSYRLEPEVYSIEECRLLISEARKCGITGYPAHIKLDTGMHRLGFLREQLPELVRLLQSQDNITPASVFSHLAVADEPARDSYTQSQFAYFDECCQLLQSGFSHHILRHILNTTGIVRFPEHQCDMVRLGIGLYGISTTSDGSEQALQPVSSLHTVIISIKEWPAGTTIGYGQRGVLTRASRIATIPIGYADGLDRHFSRGAIKMWVNGTLCPTVGNICMDVCMIDVTDARCKTGDRVEIFGSHIPVESLAKVRDTIPYEILTSISSRVKRVYYRQ